MSKQPYVCVHLRVEPGMIWYITKGIELARALASSGHTGCILVNQHASGPSYVVIALEDWRDLAGDDRFAPVLADLSFDRIRPESTQEEKP